jgi:hypothetical protein
MSGFEKIQMGMKLITEGCREQTEWTACHDCPFDSFCTMLMDSGNDDGDWEKYAPYNWDKE